MGKFNFIQTPLDGLTIVEPVVWSDERGFFMESYSLRDFEAGGIVAPFVQDNHSLSRRGVLRGLHFQRVKPQGKLVRVVRGSVLDVGVDLRPGSPTFGKWEAVLLSGENHRQLYLPPGFGHGFLALEDDTHLCYKCTDYYYPEHDAGIAWNDPKLAIGWQLEKAGLRIEDLIVSGKDRALPTLADTDPRSLEW